VSIAASVFFLGGMGLLFGLILGFASKKFHLHSDFQIQKIKAVLPDIDCGACGYKTCSGFAKAVAEGKKEPIGCVPGGSKTAHAIGDIMGVEIHMKEPLMAVVHCKGGNLEAALRCNYDGIHDCHAAILVGNGPKVCTDGCLGMGSCARACAFGAIAVNSNNVAEVNAEKCTGCGACVKVCPRMVIDLIPKVHKIYLACSNHDRGAKVKSYCSVGCTACTFCVKATLSGAITMKDNLPDIDYSTGENFVVAAHTCPSHCFVDLVKFRPKVNIDGKCDGCTICIAICPTGAISGEKGMRHVVDRTKCIGCGFCLNSCHVHAFSMWGGLGYVDGGRRKRFRIV